MNRIAPILALACASLWLVAGVARADDPFLRRTATVEVVERAGPAVLNITTEQRVAARPFQPFAGDPFFERFFQDFFEPRLPQRTQSLGSGVVIDEEGHVLTNEHVIARADVIRVTLADGREFAASLVGADPNNDLAVLRIEADESLPWVPPGTSEGLMVGEPVIAIGNPFGLSNTVTNGVLSAVNRSVRSGDDRVFHGFLQTDASINPGNSGGPLLTATGELVGINTAIYRDAQGIGFAIPIDVAKRVVRELIERGEVAPVWLGIDFQDLRPEIAEMLGLPPHLAGALVNRVREDGPAARSDLRRGDVVMKVDSTPVRSARELFEILERTTSGQELRLGVFRAGEERVVRVRTAEIPPEQLVELAERLLGMKLRPEAGALVVESVRPGSGAERIGIAPGDLVLGINGRPTDSLDALRRATLDLRGRSRALVVVQRGRGRYHVTLPLS
jgi:serine protease Do